MRVRRVTPRYILKPPPPPLIFQGHDLNLSGFPPLRVALYLMFMLTMATFLRGITVLHDNLMTVEFIYY